MLKLTQTFPKPEIIGYITGIMLAEAVRRGIATKPSLTSQIKFFPLHK